MNAQLKLASTSTLGKSTTKTISDISPNATSAQYKAFAQGLIGLTTNTYGRTDLVTTINVDTESTGKLIPTLTVSDFTKSGSLYSATIQYSGDGIVCAKSASSGSSNPALFVDNASISLLQNGTLTGLTITVTVTATPTDNYAAVTVTKSFTWEG